MQSININFNVYSNSPTHLYVRDLSDWEYAENLTSYIAITLPGSKKPKTYLFKKFKDNIFNSHNLGLSCFTNDCKEEEYLDLPDGIYTIKLLSGYENIDKIKYYLKTDRFEIERKKVLIKYNTNVDQNFINYMTKINYILDVAKSNAMDGIFVEANRYFQESKKLLNKYVECKNCL